MVIESLDARETAVVREAGLSFNDISAIPLVDRQALPLRTAGIEAATTHADPIKAKLTAFSPQAK
jgi:hypothetical protein